MKNQFEYEAKISFNRINQHKKSKFKIKKSDPQFLAK